MADHPDKRTHAQLRRAESATANRRKLQAGQFIRRLKEIADKAESVDPTAVPALRLKADIYTRLLAKCLPDLKSVEHSGNINHKHVRELSESEILDRLDRIRTIEGIVESPESPSLNS